MAIVRISGRRPTVEEMNGGATGDSGWTRSPRPALSAARSSALTATPARFPAGRFGARRRRRGVPGCRATSTLRRWRRGVAAGVGGGGYLKGSTRGTRSCARHRPGRPPPAPRSANQPCLRLRARFAEVRISTGTNEAVEVDGATMNRSLDKFALTESRSYSRRLVQNRRPSSRASGAAPRPWLAASPRRGFRHARARRLPQRPAGQG